jgi:hypothetical protein
LIHAGQLHKHNKQTTKNKRITETVVYDVSVIGCQETIWKAAETMLENDAAWMNILCSCRNGIRHFCFQLE